MAADSGVVDIVWHIGCDGGIDAAGGDHDAGVYALLKASFAVARNHTLTFIGGADLMTAVTSRPEFATAQVVTATDDAADSLAQCLCTMRAADVVLVSPGISTLLAAFIADKRAGEKPFVVGVQRKSISDTFAAAVPHNSSHPTFAPDAVLHRGKPVGKNDFEFLTALDKAILFGRGVSSVPPTTYDVYAASAAQPAPSHVKVTPYNTTWQLDNETYIHIGWYRSNASELGTDRTKSLAALDPARARLTGWNDRPGCALRSSLHVDIHDIDVVQLSRCNGTAPGGVAVPLKKLVTICATVLHGDKDSFNAYWLQAWMQHHAALGVGHFYLYVSNLTLPWFGNGLSYDILDVSSWEKGFYSHNYEGLGGALNLQPWVQHDCLYRNHAQGNTWALFMDADELVAMPGANGFSGLTRQMDEQGIDGASFGSVQYLPSPHLLTNKTRLRVPLPEGCLSTMWLPGGPWICPDWHGRRKFIARINTTVIHGQQSTMKLEIHDIANMPDRNRFALMNASRFWLMHYRGMPYESLSGITATYEGCAVNKIADGCELKGDLFLRPGNYTNDSPFVLLALAQTALPLRPPVIPAPPPSPPTTVRRRQRAS